MINSKGRRRVAVIGGGLSGLMSASRLPSRDFDVVVFEASERLGGRVRTLRDLVPGAAIEAGAELIGRNHRTWMELATRFGLRLEPVTDTADYERRGLLVRWLIGGRLLDRDEQERLQAGLEPALRTIGEEARVVDHRRPWTAPRAAELDAPSVGERLRRGDLGLEPLTLAYLELVLGNDQCQPTWAQSYLGLLAAISAHRIGSDLMAYWEQTEVYRCAGGNDQLVTALGAECDEIRLGAPVATLRIGARAVELKCAGSATSESFDFAVLAGPPRTWPEVSTDHSAGFSQSDYTLQSGPAVKYLSTFADRFWERSGLAPSVLSDAIGDVWESVQSDPEAGYTGAGLSIFSGTAYVGTPVSYAMALDSLFPGYRDQVRDAVFVDWPNVPWIRTGYSNPAPGQVTTTARRLARPYGGRLFFAGEQSSPGFFGYMEGALDAGATAAQRLVEAAVSPRSEPVGRH